MDQPETPTPADPPATYWNTSRDPAWSFACPYCGTPIRLLPVITPQPSAILMGCCLTCRTGMTQRDWEYLKAMELLQR